MTDADLLLEAVRANPDEDTPRLAYADWLQENGHEDYARYIRLSIRIAREILPPDERSELRRRRHLLGQDIVTAHPRAFPPTGWQLNHSDYGIPGIRHTADAYDFLKNWPHWWPFVRPKSLTLRAVTGLELELGHCEYLRRIDALECEGEATGPGYEREEVEWVPVSNMLLRAFANSPHLERLTALKVEPIEATAVGLLKFGESRLAARLEELHLWVQFPDGSREDLHAHAGFVKERITEFVTKHIRRLSLPSA